MIRPQPPLSALHFFAPETDEEKKLRLEMGVSMIDDVDGPEGDLEVEASNVGVIDVNPPRSVVHTLDSPGTQGMQMVNEYASSHSFPRATIGTEEKRQVSERAIMRVSTPPFETHDPLPSTTTTVGSSLSVPITQTHPVPKLSEAETEIMPFISRPNPGSLDKGKAKEIESEVRIREGSDSPIPELDSGSSDFVSDDDDGDEDMENEEAG